MADSTLKLLTLNCWGMPVIDGLPYITSKDKPARIAAISTALGKSEYDVVCLQEVWSQKDFEIIRNGAVSKLPYNVYFQGGYFGTGMAVFSKEPIVESLYFPYPLNGYVHHLHKGNYFVGVGVGLVRTSKNGLTLNVYCSHLHCKYEVGNPIDPYTPHRTLQAFQLAQTIRQTWRGADMTLLMGDMNLRESELGYKLIVSLADLFDSVKERIDQRGVVDDTTIDRPSNIYTPEELRKFPGERIDFIFFRPPQDVSVSVNSCSTTFGKINGTRLNYSDHEGVQAEMLISRGRKERKTSVVPPFDRNVILTETLKSFDDRLEGIRGDQLFHSAVVVVLLMLIGLLAYCCCGNIAFIAQTLMKFLLAFCVYHATLGLRFEAKVFKQAKQEVKLLLQSHKNS